ncbi:hypothetical protein LZ31DRAFT_600405 [Colletotrichum somersetense]|nr:hypothetical protein LZ31DRAFT_600405 [Colletotrichum somersetense]
MPHATDQYWSPCHEEYQKVLQIVEGPNERVIRFPLVVQPQAKAESKDEVLREIRRIAAQPTDQSLQSELRQLLDAKGGVVHFKGLPLKTPDDFSDFLVALSGQGIDKTDESIPVWQRRGFNWTWQENGDLEVVHRVPGVRLHPTQNKPAIFNAMSTRYTNAKVNNTWNPPHTFKNEDGTGGVAIPPHFSGLEKDEPIPKQWLERMDFYQHKLTADIKWEVGDVLVIDNYAAQHARWGWQGERKILASFWDQPGYPTKPLVKV